MSWLPFQIEESFQSPHRAPVSSSLIVVFSVSLCHNVFPDQQRPDCTKCSINSSRLYMAKNFMPSSCRCPALSWVLGAAACWGDDFGELEARTPRSFPQLDPPALSSASPTSIRTAQRVLLSHPSSLNNCNFRHSMNKKNAPIQETSTDFSFALFIQLLSKRSQYRRSELEMPACSRSELNINLCFLWRLFCLWSYGLLQQLAFFIPSLPL